MHNKELLLGVGRRDAPYTHIIHVWTQNGDIGFTYDSYGSITPEDLTGILIGAVRTYTSGSTTFWLQIGGTSTMNYYLARADRELVLRPDNAFIDHDGGRIIWYDAFFTEDDVGKKFLSGYLPDTPPTVKRHRGNNLRSRLLRRRSSLGGSRC